MVLGESILQGMQLTISFQALNGLNFISVGLHGKQGAGFNRRAVQQHGAGTAVTRVAAYVGAGQIQFFPEQLHQQQTWLYFSLVRHAIDGNCDTDVIGHFSSTRDCF
jgi:hypothetical protein